MRQQVGEDCKGVNSGATRSSPQKAVKMHEPSPLTLAQPGRIWKAMPITFSGSTNHRHSRSSSAYHRFAGSINNDYSTLK